MARFVTYRHIHCVELDGTDEFYQMLEDYCSHNDITETFAFQVWHNDVPFASYFTPDTFDFQLRDLLLKAGADYGETVYVDVC